MGTVGNVLTVLYGVSAVLSVIHVNGIVDDRLRERRMAEGELNALWQAVWALLVILLSACPVLNTVGAIEYVYLKVTGRKLEWRRLWGRLRKRR